MRTLVECRARIAHPRACPRASKSTRRAVRAASAARRAPAPAVDDDNVCDVAIVGAGPGGLAAALALQRQGLDVRVFEQREEFRPAGVAIFIWPHGLNALKSFDPETTERVVDAGAVIDTIAIEQLQPGGTEAEELVRIDVAGWSRRMDLPPQIGITWARLTNALRAGLRPDTVRLAHRLACIYDDDDGVALGPSSGGVTLTFEPPRNGGDAPPPVRARMCVVGADGRNSRVRELTFGEEDASSSAAASSPASSAAAPEANVYYALSPNPPPGANGAGSFNELRFSLCDGSGISLLDVGRGNLDIDGGDSPGGDSPGGGQLMFGTTRFSEPARTFDTPERRLAHLESLFENTTPLLKAAIASTSPAAVVQTRLYERDGASRWSKGRVTLLGDAAHCMYPSLGLGISTAFQDAVELANCLSSSDGGGIDSDVREALATYERRRIPPCWALQTGSRLMHRVLAATSERAPAGGERGTGGGERGGSGAIDLTGVFFRAWRGVLWLLGDREEERAVTEAENAKKAEKAAGAKR